MSKNTIISSQENSFSKQQSHSQSYKETQQTKEKSGGSNIGKYETVDGIIDFIFAFIKFLFESMTTAYEVVIRKNFGERYFTVTKFLIGGFLILVLMTGSFIPDIQNDFQPTFNSIDEQGKYTGVPNLFQRPFTEDDLERIITPDRNFFGRGTLNLPEIPNFNFFFYLVYFIAYVYFGFSELGKQAQRMKEGTAWHSYHTGESRFRFFAIITEQLNLKSLVGSQLVANHITQLYIEPLFFFSVGLAMLPFNYTFAAFLILGSFFTLIKGQVMYNKVRTQILDIKDNMIESKFMAQAIKGVDPKNTAGLSTLSIRPATTNNAVSTAEALNNVFRNNPELEKLAGLQFKSKA